jgi:hypothetical protein
MKEFAKFTAVMFIFALLAGISPKAEAADTRDVIGGILFGGWLGSEWQKNKHPIEPYVTHFPHGTIIVPGYKKTRNMQCYFEMDTNNMPLYAVPTCSTSGSSYYNKHSNKVILQHDLYPCGSYWGYRCRKLVEDLKSGVITGVFDFNN